MKRFLAILTLITVSLCLPVLAKREKTLSLGKISLGQTMAKVTRQLGPPKEKSETKEEPATGELVQTWSYPDIGVEIDFSRTDEKKAFTVYRVTATEPCDFRGYMGLNIGAFQVEVEALAKQLEKEPGIEVSRSEGGYGFLWTESYQMLSVGITDGKVSQLYIGPGPE